MFTHFYFSHLVHCYYSSVSLPQRDCYFITKEEYLHRVLLFSLEWVEDGYCSYYHVNGLDYYWKGDQLSLGDV